jgi:hypothetical protein
MTPGELVLSILLVAATFVLSLVSSDLSRTRARERLRREQLEAMTRLASRACVTPCANCGHRPVSFTRAV